MRQLLSITQVVAVCMFSFLLGCTKEEIPAETKAINNIPVITPVTPLLAETSGIADSKVNPGYLWAHEDGGNPAQLYLLRHNGELAKTIYLKGTTNRDWEDMLLSGNELYIADIGDNTKVNQVNTIYKFREPDASTDTVKSYTSIKFTYPDGAHDAEAFLVDHASKNIYIITKRDNTSRIYKISFPCNTSATNTAELVGSLSYNGVVSAALSDDGREIIIKTYTQLYHYERKGNEPIEQTLQKNYNNLPYTMEPQGEAVTFSVSSNGYFTLSEKAFANNLNLYFYRLR
ncbi:hypothetical protein H8S95_11235 [Pontibacter sp. KCTC 32443]|uniref:hypothetical protein n=1 Tax=Pontibacter TaxID=323449 RepID=UPI00164D5EBE|nr:MULTISPECIES: hypothetical protein [Pontibacter]MBC5774636.1 hypothetical protein [Pontibacter sp. KCTC 32443]